MIGVIFTIIFLCVCLLAIFYFALQIYSQRQLKKLREEYDKGKLEGKFQEREFSKDVLPSPTTPVIGGREPTSEGDGKPTRERLLPTTDSETDGKVSAKPKPADRSTKGSSGGDSEIKRNFLKLFERK